MINIAVEGESDREMASAVAREAGKSVNKVRVAGGKTRLDPLIPKYNNASAQTPWVVFRDSDSRCPVSLRAELGAQISRWNASFSLRVAHTMSEAWLLADAEAFSSYFAVSRARVPVDPEALPHATRTLLALCADSRSAAIRRDVTASGGAIGPLFVSRINDFASTVWRPALAVGRSDSLRRAVNRIRELDSSRSVD
ncbi:hypothetical protein C5E08_14620 [Rathayibacter iranicus]|uniref:DUF4276 family protein n=2 Tax=Rathayibacter iranicus TaxID=59737 RepID=A0AAD1EN88_9MICO|nr:hypothetical protein C7V51_14865 [Rathayibacter iranicus]PPI41936.1 hypothetical protein C5E09_13720 [Rathayibacter iranicus]PPI57677.1 hypothetical protein C5E08_14620 [Rathayibacter iranicus]PPI68655.1 hypothetical protein C5E01_13675 [Rathayibacter iranicus]PWJ66706.1 hypothetical protein B0H03_101158 [Rathayibacter iranicus NCPPB 2253 = VKM Ac-1602]